jgi:hypothetical protein
VRLRVYARTHTQLGSSMTATGVSRSWTRTPREPADKRMTFVFRLPPIGQMERIVRLHEFVFQLIDVIAEVVDLRGEVRDD